MNTELGRFLRTDRPIDRPACTQSGGRAASVRESLALGVCALALVLGLTQVSGGIPAPGTNADNWVTNAVIHPGVQPGVKVDAASFQDLHASGMAGRLMILGPTLDDLHPIRAEVCASAADVAHWPTRDWGIFPMTRSGRTWQADVTVEDLDVPLVYYAKVETAAGTTVSPLRVVVPRGAGLEEPTRVFWPFLDGFETGLDHWRLWNTSDDSSPPRISHEARHGKAALLITNGAGQRSVTVATTRVRGWQLVQEGATGLRVWARTRRGAGRLRCWLKANAGGEAEKTMAWPQPIELGESWQKVDLSFAQLGTVPWRSVDLLGLEFSGGGSAGFLLDDLQFLGPWRLEPE